MTALAEVGRREARAFVANYVAFLVVALAVLLVVGAIDTWQGAGVVIFDGEPGHPIERLPRWAIGSILLALGWLAIPVLAGATLAHRLISRRTGHPRLVSYLLAGGGAAALLVATGALGTVWALGLPLGAVAYGSVFVVPRA